jgi:iron-sulfur cluster repair di-iron protein
MNPEVNFSNLTIAELLTANFNFYEVLKKYDINFDKYFNKKLNIFCQEEQLDLLSLNEELNDKHAENKTESVTEESFLNILTLEQLCELIHYKYHHYLITNIPLIQASLKEAKDKNLFENIEDVYTLFSNTITTLLEHIRMEEDVLFPSIKEMLSSNNPIPVKELINQMEDEHEEEGVYFRKMESLTNNYTPPNGADSQTTSIFKQMKDFHICLMKHVYIENNVLFTKVNNSAKAM